MASLPEEEITFACQECGKRITFPAYSAGHVEICAECGRYVDVPRESELPSSGETQAELPRSLDPAARTNAQLWFEVSAVLCLAYLPWLSGAIMAVNTDRALTYSFVSDRLWQIIDGLQVSMPLLVIIALAGDRWSLFGIVRPKWFTDVIAACVICFCCIMFRDFVAIFLPRSLFSVPGPRHFPRSTLPEGIPAYLLLFTACAASGFAQELIFRGYLIPRFERLLHSTPVAVIVTTAMFASYHVYQGTVPVILAAVIGFVFAIAFCLLHRLWPLCVAHALYNALVVLHLTR